VAPNERNLVIRDVSVVDPKQESVQDKQKIVVRDGSIVEVSADSGGSLSDAFEIDGRGTFAMPGLIDCHVHVTAANADLWALAGQSPYYAAAFASRSLKDMLRRGFTTVRDTGGADFGLANALSDGLLQGPRLIYGGKALSHTGGHGDVRPAGVGAYDSSQWVPGLGRVCDGISEIRRAVRDEVRRGAAHIKLMLSGGCASLTDRIDSLQFSDEEVAAAVAEATNAGIYCAGHAYTAEAVSRALRLGVRTIEHGNLIDKATAELFLQFKAFYVPTIVTYEYLAAEAQELGFSAANLSKVNEVRAGALDALRMADEAGADIAFGSDLLGPMQRHQSKEFELRAGVQSAGAVLRSATETGAKLLNMPDLGQLLPGKTADILLTNRNPLADVRSLAYPEQHVMFVIAKGRLEVSPQ
jgi:imidazolonepropionase-like amidohydrolase